MNSQIPAFVAQQYQHIRVRIIEKFETLSNFWFYLGLDHANGSRILNGYKFLEAEERKLWSEALDLPASAFPQPIYRIRSESRRREIVGWSNDEDNNLN